MELENLTTSDWFLIVGFSDLPQLRIPLFAAFLVIYLMTLIGNLLIMVTIYTSTHLHTPMYFFLSNLSFIEICYTSVTFPQMLAHFFLEGTRISLTECMSQVYFFVLMLSAEVFLLTAMAYDRYVAICNPLRYMTIMNKTMCISLVAGSWIVGFLEPLPHTILVGGLSFCKSHTINHFYCDVTALMRISCGSTHRIEILNYILGSIATLMSFLLIIISYVNIVSSILKIKSTAGRQKAFSTCSSHLIVVILFYVSLCSTYMAPASTYSMKDNKIKSFLYTAITPLLNPVIYSLKNKEFKIAFRRQRASLHGRR
ncbi:olfactory receptor 8D1-like [Ambystoma mexicanum]|uniref:olfactory receptor 8D1-like n=1 Tax=Ambystoma mexicanum TaxID=8296 RepID=UPI0037E710BD